MTITNQIIGSTMAVKSKKTYKWSIKEFHYTRDNPASLVDYTYDKQFNDFIKKYDQYKILDYGIYTITGE